MKHWSIAALLALVVLVSTAAALSWRRFAASPSPARSGARADISAIERRLAELETRPSHERVVYVHGSAQPPAQAAPHSDASPPEAPAPVDEARMMLEKQTAATALLDARFVNETPDPAFSREATQAARQGVEDRPGSRVATVECVSSLCKVVITHDSLEEQRGIGTKVESVPLFGEGTYFSYERDVVPPRTTLYVVRRGHSFQE
jgi:hypothetical protein